jgi:sodium transport system permease protein
MARSYREAQSYLTPLLMLVIFPAMVSLIPGFEFKPIHSFIPVLNTSLVLKDVLLGTYHWGSIGLVFLVNAVYAGFGILVAKQTFEKESVLFRV